MMPILSIVDSVNDFLDVSGLGDPFSKAFLVIALMVTFSIMLQKSDAPYAAVILVNTLVLILGVVFGLIPIWILLIIFFSVIAYILLVLFDISPGSIGKRDR